MQTDLDSVVSTAWLRPLRCTPNEPIQNQILKGSVTPTRAPALPTPAPALLDSPRGGTPPAPRKTAVWTAMTPPHGVMTPPDAMTPPLA
ncbi:uncharacterized protein F5147DRAFT_780552 [Suillus discolor]|uniref:Uncharacterized protein n=1 Tax=Suillus discolor TaxID=1912936 RepID=A0A9P7EV18_9AGAM|nr:uncharacterized protein F5147DRAFT_780552 [Suillus discolor]KAG2089757.1 hypothetical protein F5147DRAFT_780552 [Suillus discolor]